MTIITQKYNKGMTTKELKGTEKSVFNTKEGSKGKTGEQKKKIT